MGDLQTFVKLARRQEQVIEEAYVRRNLKIVQVFLSLLNDTIDLVGQRLFITFLEMEFKSRTTEPEMAHFILF